MTGEGGRVCGMRDAVDPAVLAGPVIVREETR